MEKKSHSTKRLLLIDDPGLGQIHADLEAFFDFSFWMAEELEDLTAQWAHKAAPRANRHGAPVPQERC